MANNYDNEDGVWRTIGGRRVFIKKGQSLADAMKESGKFKSKQVSKGVREDEYVGQDDKVHKMMTYEYPEDRDEYHKYLIKKYGTFKEEEIKGEDGRTDYKKLRQEFYDYQDNKNSEKELSPKEINSLQHEARKLRNEAENTTGKDSDEAWKKFDDVNDKLGKDRIDKRYDTEFYNNEIDKISKMDSLDDRKQAIRRLEERTGTDRKVIQDALDEKDYDKHLGEEYERRFGKEKETLNAWQKRKQELLNGESQEAKKDYEDYVRNALNNDEYLQANRPNEYFNKMVKESGVKTFADEIKEQENKTSNENQITNALKNKAYQNYMKQHPNSEMTLEEFKNGRSNKPRLQLTNNEIKNVKTQKALKQLIDDNKATDITSLDDKKTKALREKHGHLEAVKITKGTYGMNGALLRSDKTGEYFVITSRNSNLFYWV